MVAVTGVVGGRLAGVIHASADNAVKHFSPRFHSILWLIDFVVDGATVLATLLEYGITSITR